MSFLYAARNLATAGRRFLSTPLGPCVSSSPDADYPASNAVDQHVSPPTRWADLVGTYYLDAAMNVVACSDMEQAGLTGWTFSGVGSAQAAPYKGTYSVEIPNSVTASQLITLTAGATWQFSGAVYDVGDIYLRDAERGGNYYVNTSGSWTTTPTAILSGSASAWTQAERTFTTPTLRGGWNRPDGLLRLELIGGDNGGDPLELYRYDEVMVYPGVDVFALIGHNFPPTATLSILYSATDYWHGTPATTLATSSSALRFPVGWYVHGSAVYEPYWRVQVDYPESGTAPRKPMLGELFVGKTAALPNPAYGPRVEWTDEQVRTRSSGKLWAYRQAGHPRRKVTLSFPCSTDAEWETLRDSLGLTSGMGATPGLLIPTEMELDQALYVNIGDVVTYTRGPRTHRVVDVVFEEMPFPVME